MAETTAETTSKAAPVSTQPSSGQAAPTAAPAATPAVAESPAASSASDLQPGKFYLNAGVYAHTNAIGAPALLPDGSVAEKSISQTLVVRGATVDAAPLARVTNETFAAIEGVLDADDDEDEE